MDTAGPRLKTGLRQLTPSGVAPFIAKRQAASTMFRDVDSWCPKARECQLSQLRACVIADTCTRMTQDSRPMRLPCSERNRSCTPRRQRSTTPRVLSVAGTRPPDLVARAHRKPLRARCLRRCTKFRFDAVPRATNRTRQQLRPKPNLSIRSTTCPKACSRTHTQRPSVHTCVCRWCVAERLW